MTDEPSNAVWGVRFIRPIRAEVRIVCLDPEVALTVIGRTKRAGARIVARRPRIPEAGCARILSCLRGPGDDTGKIRNVPQSTG